MGLLSPIMRTLHAPVYASRLRELVARLAPHLRAGDRLLDVGCGNGTLARALMDARPGLAAEGLERVVRGGEPIPVHAYDGRTIPFADGAFDVVVLADVLHHEPDPDRLLRECARVTRRLLIIKDHQVAGFLAQQRISLLDWAANAPYGVPCLYRYLTPAQWAALPASLGLRAAHVVGSMPLYPWPYRWVFGGRVQYLAVLTREPAP
jgi:SAM-dependent methyltransferase